MHERQMKHFATEHIKRRVRHACFLSGRGIEFVLVNTYLIVRHGNCEDTKTEKKNRQYTWHLFIFHIGIYTQCPEDTSITDKNDKS